MSDSTSSSVEYRIDHEQLLALRNATRSSKTMFDSDISALSNSVSLIDTDSPIVSEMVNYLGGLLGDASFDEGYNSAIGNINYYL